jgi:hypothetical protein
MAPTRSGRLAPAAIVAISKILRDGLGFGGAPV